MSQRFVELFFRLSLQLSDNSVSRRHIPCKIALGLILLAANSLCCCSTRKQGNYFILIKKLPFVNIDSACSIGKNYLKITHEHYNFFRYYRYRLSLLVSLSEFSSQVKISDFTVLCIVLTPFLTDDETSWLRNSELHRNGLLRLTCVT